MGPSGRTRTRTRTRTARKGSRRTSSSSSSSQLIKKNRVVRRPKNQETTPRVNSPSNSLSSSDDFLKTEGIEFEAVDDVVVSTSGCSTPKGQRFRIPEVMTCPPAPKKQRVISNCSLQRSPIAFFAPPDLELFFYFALRGISV